MYLVSLYEQEGFIEASLGGRVTADEIQVFGEELREIVEAFEAKPFQVLLDFSRARRLDGDGVTALAEVKDSMFAMGASQIVNVPGDEHDMVLHQSSRLQQVLEGLESFVSDPAEARFERRQAAALRFAA